MTAEERLQELLDQKDEELEKLQSKVWKLEEQAERDHLWTQHLSDETADEGGLPVPRLEIVWHDRGSKHRGYRWLIRYDLVKYHLVGEINRIPMGSTQSDSTRPPITPDGEVDLPFRDGAHIKFDALELGLPAFAIYGDSVTELDPSDHSGVVNGRKKRGIEVL